MQPLPYMTALLLTMLDLVAHPMLDLVAHQSLRGTLVVAAGR